MKPMRQVNVLCVALLMPPSPFARWKQLKKAWAAKKGSFYTFGWP